MAVLLEDGLKRALAHPDTTDIMKRMFFHRIEATHYMQSVCLGHSAFDVVYLDPMFPNTEKKNLQSKKGNAVFTKLAVQQWYIRSTIVAKRFIVRALSCRC